MVKIGFIFGYLPKIPHITLALNLYLYLDFSDCTLISYLHFIYILLSLFQNYLQKKNKSDKRTYFFVNGGTDEARTRDLLRDRQTL